jgi:steroid Delta-isomerase
MSSTTDAGIRHIYEQWHQTIQAKDLDGIMALYADDAVFESPAVLAVLRDRDEGVLHGKTEITRLFATNFRVLSAEFAKLYRTGIFLANNNLLMWEYPRQTPAGEQVDLVESMDIENGLIVYHRVYWGWKGLKALMAARERPAD